MPDDDDQYDYRKFGENPKDEVAFICDIPPGVRVTQSFAKKMSEAYEANGRKPLTEEQVEAIADSEEVVPMSLADRLTPNIGGSAEPPAAGKPDGTKHRH